MENFAYSILSYSLSGALVGVVIGLTGVGGGSLMTPLLTLLLGAPPAIAVGTALAFAALTKGAGTLAHRLHGHVRRDIVICLSLGSLPAAVVSIGFLHQLGPLNDYWNQAIRYSIGASLCITILSLVFRKQLLDWVDAHPGLQLHGRAQQFATVLAGAVIGVIVSITSVGAGTIGATLILLLHPKLRAPDLAGTVIAYAVPLTAVAGLGHWWLGSIHLGLLAGLLVGSVPGIWVGAHLAKKLPEVYVRGALAATLTLVSIKLVT